MAEDDLAILSWLVILVHRPRIGTPGRERRKTLTSNAKIRSEGGQIGSGVKSLPAYALASVVWVWCIT